MSCAYIVLMANMLGEHEAGQRAEMLREMDMREWFASGRISLYCSRETPVCRLRCGGILLGHAFNRAGARLADGTDLAGHLNCTQIQKYLLENCWGEYLLFQPDPRGDSSWTFMRDPSGGISCIYALQQGCGFITSDISLATHLGLYRRRVDWEFIPHCLTYPNTKTSRTGLMGIRELLPGHALHARGKHIAIEQVWSPWSFVARGKRHSDPQEAARDVRNSVTTAVSAWARADQSILLELSGGLDSSIVAACLHGTGARVNCCTLVTPMPGADERQYARLMADYLGTELQSIELRVEDARFSFVPPPSLVKPAITALQYAVDGRMEAAGAHHEVTSFFSGGGGDTVFCYLNGAVPAADAFQEKGLAAGLTAIWNLSEMHQCTFWKAARLTGRKLLRGSKPPYKANTAFLSSTGTATAAEIHPWLTAQKNALAGDLERITDLAGTQTFREGIPRAGKLRFRMPLLSQPIVEACLRVPTWMWIADGRNRSIARSAFSDVLPREVLQRRSKGTFVSYTGAVYRRNKDQIRDFLLAGALRTNGLIDADELERFLQSELTPRDQSFMRVFQLCAVENWIRHQG